MKWKFAVPAFLAAAIVAACGDDQTVSEGIAEKEAQSEQQEQKMPTVTQGQTDDIKGLVANYSSNKTTEEKASITSQQLIVMDADANETVYTLPENEFFVSIAPFINETHPCKDHSLTGCQGELVGKEIDVLIENGNGEVIVDETMTTMQNGFIDLWLPRDEAYVIELSHNGKKVSGDLTTFEEDGTCVTTLQLI